MEEEKIEYKPIKLGEKEIPSVFIPGSFLHHEWKKHLDSLHHSGRQIFRKGAWKFGGLGALAAGAIYALLSPEAALVPTAIAGSGLFAYLRSRRSQKTFLRLNEHLVAKPPYETFLSDKREDVSHRNELSDILKSKFQASIWIYPHGNGILLTSLPLGYGNEPSFHLDKEKLRIRMPAEARP
ncbi:MAG: hypothetical protein AABX01_08180 [Candidatus Micrarchaeota archaeon]